MTTTAIIPTFNEERNIRGALDSLAAQTSRPSVIIVDGGSTDETLLRAYTLRHILPELDIEIYAHRDEACPTSQNYGAMMARPGILVFLGADVRLETDTFARIEREFAEHPGLLALTGLAIPFGAGSLCKLEYLVYYTAAHLFNRARLRFIANNTFLAVNRQFFIASGGFPLAENPDAIFAGRIPAARARVDVGIRYHVNGRRYNQLGFGGFNRYYNFCVENFLPWMHRLTVREVDTHEKVARRHLH